MAIDRTGINSLDAGATKSPSGSSIKYEGDIFQPQKYLFRKILDLFSSFEKVGGKHRFINYYRSF